MHGGKEVTTLPCNTVAQKGTSLARCSPRLVKAMGLKLLTTALLTDPIKHWSRTAAPPKVSCLMEA